MLLACPLSVCDHRNETTRPYPSDLATTTSSPPTSTIHPPRPSTALCLHTSPTPHPPPSDSSYSIDHIPVFTDPIPVLFLRQVRRTPPSISSFPAPSTRPLPLPLPQPASHQHRGRVSQGPSITDQALHACCKQRLLFCVLRGSRDEALDYPPFSGALPRSMSVLHRLPGAPPSI